MRLYETEDGVRELELRRAGGDNSAELSLQLAWYLRQTDRQRSAALLEAVAGTCSPEQLCRSELLQIEWRFFDGEIAVVIELLDELLLRLTGAGEFAVAADAAMLQGLIRSVAGDAAGRNGALARAVQFAREAGDGERVIFISATLARYEVIGDAVRWTEHWEPILKADNVPCHPAVAAAVSDCEGVATIHRGDPVVSIRLLQSAFANQAVTGQIANAIVTANNIAEALTEANDFDGGLEWAQRALDLAKPRGWPLLLGLSLKRMGENLRHIGRLDAAQSILAEALDVHQAFRHSRMYSTLLIALGETALSADKADSAAGYFAELLDRATRAGQPDLLLTAHQGLAGAAIKSGDVSLAETHVQAGLALALEQRSGVREIALRRLLADLRRAAGDTAAARLELSRALSVAESFEGFVVPPELLLELARVYADNGEYRAAYEFSMRANTARDQLGLAEAEQRATAIQIRIDTERARAEAEQQRQRADILQQGTLTLQHLGAIGQEITAQLDTRQVFEAIYRHVNDLLPAECFSIYLMNADGHAMVSVFDIENGQPIGSDQVSLSDESSYSARCVNERREMLVDFSGPADDAGQIPGTLDTQSALYAPLLIGDRVLGVMTIQSVKRSAYGEAERLIFRTLCAYAAIALDNAVAYTHLRETQAQLVAQEKMAALGALVAGVAHELNTPIGNAVLTTSALQTHTTELGGELGAGTLKRTRLVRYVGEAETALELIMRGLKTAAELVQTFKQVAVDRATEQRRRFDLADTTADIIATLTRTITAAGHRIDVDIAEGIELDAYPGPYGQVLTNLISNAMIHGFGERQGGTMRLVARNLPQQRVEVVFSDDGVGISAEGLKRVFDPFYTTRLGQGGSGLGLAISHTIATSLFGGQLSVHSAAGAGTRYVWVFPCVAPQHPGTEPHRT